MGPSASCLQFSSVITPPANLLEKHPTLNTFSLRGGVTDTEKRLVKHKVESTLGVEQIRLISDLRVMHSKVDELLTIVEHIRKRHDPEAVVEFADRTSLTDDINAVDKIYMWFVKLDEQRSGRSG